MNGSLLFVIGTNIIFQFSSPIFFKKFALRLQ